MFHSHRKNPCTRGQLFQRNNLNEVDFDQHFEQMTNQQIELIYQLEQKQGRDDVWFNEDVQMHELDNVINNLHNTACSSGENKFNPKMFVKSGLKFRICLVSLFSSCLTKSV